MSIRINNKSRNFNFMWCTSKDYSIFHTFRLTNKSTEDTRVKYLIMQMIKYLLLKATEEKCSYGSEQTKN